MAEPDVLFRAEVDDKTLEFFDRFDRNVEKIAQSAQQGFQQIDRRIDQSGKQIGIIGGLVGGLTTKLIDMGLQAAAALKGFITESINLRARVDTLGITLNLVGQRMGKTAEETARAEEEVKSMGITTSAARQSLVRMARANIDWAEASHLARIAQNAAVVAGIDSSAAFNRLILGIQKMEPELLDELGITLNRTQAYKALADQMGVTTKELSIQEKQQAILNEIYKQSEVVAGAYEAAMGSVGKQMTSLPRHIEELQLAIGGAFQPALQEQVAFMTERLKELREWFEKNEESVARFAVGVGKAANLAFNALGKLIDLASKLPGLIESSGVTLAQIINNFTGVLTESQFEESVSNLATTWKQFIVILVTGAATAGSAIYRAGELIVAQLNIIKEALAGGDVDAALDAFANKWENMADNIVADVKRAVDSTMDLVFAVKEVQDVADSVSVSPITPIDGDDMQGEADKATDALKQVDDALRALHKRQSREAEDRAISRAREDFEEQIRLSWQIEDMERQHQERLSQIRKQYQEDFTQFQEDAAERRLELEEDKNKKAIEIEERFRQQLSDLQRRFEFQAEELARNRDAVGLLRLMRNHEQALEEERTQRDRASDEAKEDYEEQLNELEETLREQEAQIKESFAKQIAEAQEAYKKQQEEFQRNLARQRQMKELHRQWEEEDRQRAYQRELEDMAEQFASMEGLTEEGLNEILAHWEQYLGDLSVIAEEYQQITAEMAASAARVSGMTLQTLGSRPGSRPGGTGQPLRDFTGMERDGRVRNPGAGSPTYTIDPNAFQNQPGTPHTTSHVTGQAGQVSQLLSDSMMNNFFSKTPQIPSVVPSTGRDTREIIVKGDIAGMEPIFQRQLVRGLLEIERNRGE